MNTVPMVVPLKSAPTSPHADFLAVLPIIELRARFAFRRLHCPQERDEAVAEAIALVWIWFCRLRERGKSPHNFIVTLVSFAVQHVRAGRRFCGIENSQDALSRVAQQRHNFRTEQLETRGSYEAPQWQEALTDNMQSPVPDAVAFRIDFPAWLKTWKNRDRRLIEALAIGERTCDVAKRFGVTPGRIAQKRCQYRKGWECYCGESVTA